MDIYALINDPTKLDQDTCRQLRRLVEEHPFHQLARLLYVYNLYLLRHSAFHSELLKAGAMLPDRRSLFHLIEGQNYDIEKQGALQSPTTITTEHDSNRTVSLIDSYLSTQADTEEPTDTATHSLPTVAEATNDYATFLLMQDQQQRPAEDAKEVENQRLRGANLIDNFIAETQGKQRYDIAEVPEDTTPHSGVTLTHAPSDNDDILNENIIDLYITQGRYEQALEIIQRICLNNPEKMPTFATQMQRLEQLQSDITPAPETAAPQHAEQEQNNQ